MSVVPWSAEEGRAWTRERVAALNPFTVLDVGPGAGAYADLLWGAVPNLAVMDAVEIHEPYIERFGLREKYDTVTVADAVDFLEKLERRELDYDVVILGDVLEHVEHDRAVALWQLARKVARQAVFLSLPIHGYEQGECEGNPHEAHLYQWSDASVRSELDGIVDGQAMSIVGVYQARPL